MSYIPIPNTPHLPIHSFLPVHPPIHSFLPVHPPYSSTLTSTHSSQSMHSPYSSTLTSTHSSQSMHPPYSSTFTSTHSSQSTLTIPPPSHPLTPPSPPPPLFLHPPCVTPASGCWDLVVSRPGLHLFHQITTQFYLHTQTEHAPTHTLSIHHPSPFSHTQARYSQCDN
ncbi:hypothetical protein Pcinc_031667 [Petrolisthes cinctipes]|uniref:Uncharacterized protein n=1 Tax=Petrolisthes cinctipes TaxID=88211 RepID=A0AAE1EVY3_PETCI|nr:hypothetical protein Pcinc_031667 [Petrolisthes cinctipes]